MNITTLHPDTKMKHVVLRLVQNNPTTHCLSITEDNCPQGNQNEILKHKNFLSGSTPSPATTVSLVEIKENWIRLIGSAQTYWWRLSKKDLGTTNGQELKLIALVRKHYLVGKFEARQQVRRFFQQTQAE